MKVFMFKNKFQKSTLHGTNILSMLVLLAACENADFAVEKAADSSIGVAVPQSILAKCTVIDSKATFNAGSGTDADPYIICNEQQFLNISQAEFSKLPSMTSAGEVKFPYMSKVFKLGVNLNFEKSGVEFFSLGHFMGSLGRSKAISDSDKYLVATHDSRNLSSYISALSTQRVPFTGVLDGGGYVIEIGDYAPTESRMVGLFSALAPGATIKNLNLKNFNIYAKGGVNIGCLAGSLADTSHMKVWKDKSTPPSSPKVVIDKVSIDGCKMYDVVANSGGLLGVARSYLGQDLSVSNIKLSNILIDGGIETKLEPAYGDEIMQAVPVLNQFHNIGILAGYAQIDGKANFSNIVVEKGEVSLVGFYTGAEREEDLGNLDYINNAFLEDYTFIDHVFNAGLSDSYVANDPVRAVGTLFGALNTSSNLARLTVSNVSISESKASFYEAAKNVGSVAGSIGLLGGIVTIQDLTLKSNMIKFGINEWSLPSSGVGLFAGSISIANSGANYTFNLLNIDGQIIADFAEGSSEIAGFAGSIQALDEVVIIDTKLNFSDIKINGTASLRGVDLRSLGAFAGSIQGTGEAPAPSAGVNKVSMSKVESDFVISTADNYAFVVGGLAGYLGRGTYVMNQVAVRTSIDLTNPFGFYNNVNSVVGMFSSNAAVTITGSSYAPLRPEFASGIPTPQANNFLKL
jgi:hypothetical protein